MHCHLLFQNLFKKHIFATNCPIYFRLILLDRITYMLPRLIQDAQGQETNVDIKIATEDFSASGLMIIARNYLDVYPYEKWNARVIPVYQMGETFEPTAIEVILRNNAVMMIHCLDSTRWDSPIT